MVQLVSSRLLAGEHQTQWQQTDNNYLTVLEHLFSILQHCTTRSFSCLSEKVKLTEGLAIELF